MSKTNDIDRYIAGFPVEARVKIEQFRSIIKKVAPEAEEVISYKMPAFKHNGLLVYFAGYARHIGFYPMPSAIEKFKDELSTYKWAKGSVQFPLDMPLPVKLIEKMVRFRLKENIQIIKAKKK